MSSLREAAPAAAVPQASLVLLLWGDEMAAWQVVPGRAPRALPLQGQTRLRVGSSQAIANARADVAERLRGEGLAVAEVHWLADAAGRSRWAGCQPQLQALPGAPHWQLLAWEWLAARFGWSAANPWEILSMLEGELLPWLVSADDAAERQAMQAALAREHHCETERLAAERTHLLQQNDRLRTQNAALQQVDAERLVSFLPALFPRVFTVLGAADLALLCGRIEALPIPNPYPEPSEETLRTLQRNFRALPHPLQKQIAGFVARLPQRQKLQPRPEIRELVHELEED